MYELPSHLMPHPSEVQEEMMSPAETLLRAGPWGFSMVSDSTGYVACPGCGQRVSDERTPGHAARCGPLRQEAK